MPRSITTGILSLLLCLSLWLPNARAQPQTSVDLSAPPARGLLAWWKGMRGFTGGRFLYDLLGHTHATLESMGTSGTTSGWRVSTQAGWVGEVAFDGVNDRVTVPVAPSLEPPAMTIMLWAKAVTWGGDYRMLFDINASGGVVRQIMVDINGRLAVYFYTSTAALLTADPVSGTVLATGVWHHVALSYSQTDGLRVFLNCRQETALAPNGTSVVTNAAAAFGSRSTSIGRLFAGSMNDMRIYNRVVPPLELCTIMHNARRESPPGLGDALIAMVVSALKEKFFPFFTR